MNGTESDVHVCIGCGQRDTSHRSRICNRCAFRTRHNDTSQENSTCEPKADIGAGPWDGDGGIANVREMAVRILEDTE